MVNLKIGIVIQARLNSNRLPGKALLPLPNASEKTLLEQIIRRALAVKYNPEIIIATSTRSENDELEIVAKRNQVQFFRGEEEDVLARFYAAATAFNLDIIIRLTADNPFIDPFILSQILQEHIDQQADYTVTTGLPIGLNVEMLNFKVLEQCFQETMLPEHREHVTLYIRQNPAKFKILYKNFGNQNYGSPNWRLTVDNENDYAFACALFLLLDRPSHIFTLHEIVQLLNTNPALLLINKDNYQKKVFKNVQEELTEAIQMLQSLDFPQAAKILASQIL